MVGPNEVQRAILIAPRKRAVRPDVLADQAAGAGGVVEEILGNALAIGIKDVVYSLAQRRRSKFPANCGNHK